MTGLVTRSSMLFSKQSIYPHKGPALLIKQASFSGKLFHSVHRPQAKRFTTMQPLRNAQQISREDIKRTSSLLTPFLAGLALGLFFPMAYIISEGGSKSSLEDPLTSSSLGKRQVQPEETHSSDGQKHAISPPDIDFKHLREVAASGIFTNEEIRNYALKSLDKIEDLNNEIINQIKQHSSNDSGFKASVHEKVNQIMKDIIHPSNFPRVFSQDLLTSLATFFSPISQECIRLKKELSHEENEQKEKNNHLTLEKEKKLGQLLAKEQKILAEFKTFSTFLETLSEEIANGNVSPNVYFAHAWPTNERTKKELWVHPFLKHLQDQLKTAGIYTAQLHIDSKRHRANVYEYANIYECMERIEAYDYVLLFGTESLKGKYDGGISAVCDKVIFTLERKKSFGESREKKLNRVFPILISGNHEISFPVEYERYLTVRDWRQGGYLENFQRLYLELFNFPPERYTDEVEIFWNEALNIHPSESKEIQDTLQRCKKKRQQINGCTDLDHLSKITLTGLADRPISQKTQEFT